MSNTFASIIAPVVAGVQRAKKPLMDETIRILLRYADRNTPDKTGTLRRGNQSDVSASGDYGRVFNQVPYANYVHGGTRPHVIRPRSPGGVLAFTIGGQMIFAKRVNHPGTRANPFYDHAVSQSASEINALLARTGLQIMDAVPR